MSRLSSFGSIADARDASCDNLHPGEVHLVFKPNVREFRRMCTYLDKRVIVSYYNIYYSQLL